MFDVDVVALLSYDQVRFHDTNGLAVLYWSIVGAYFIQGDQYDVQTLLDAAVFDVKSRKLLFRAPGTSQVKGMASQVAFSEEARAAQSQGYQEALARLIPQLQTELGNFRERVKSDPQQFKLGTTPGHKGAGGRHGAVQPAARRACGLAGPPAGRRLRRGQRPVGHGGYQHIAYLTSRHESGLGAAGRL
jgi:rhombotail lipoprotein